MSHFTVLVVGDDVEAQLQPFHEYECTGTEDQYVVPVNETERARGEYETRMERMVRLADGTEVSFYDRQFYHQHPTEAWRSEHRLPEDATEFQVPVKDLRDFRTYLAEDWDISQFFAAGEKYETKGLYRYAEVDKDGNVVKVLRRTNPNAKWDWWVVGGRWDGFFLLKDGKNASEARKGDIDFEAMREKAAQEAGEFYDKVHGLAGARWTSFKEILEAQDNDADKARELYHAQEPVMKIRKEVFVWDLDRLLVDREDYVTTARNGACATYAVLKDGQWYAHGEMGWFGMSDDTLTAEEWNQKFSELIDGLDDDIQLTVVDCHI